MSDFKAHILCTDLAGPAFAGTDVVLDLRQAGFRVTMDSANWGAATLEPDYLIADLRGTAPIAPSTLDDLHLLVAKHPTVPLFLLQTFAQQRAGLSPMGLDIDATLITTDPGNEALLYALDRNNTTNRIRAECVARELSLAKLGNEEPRETSAKTLDPVRVLLAGSPCPATLDLLQLFLRHDIEASAALTAPQAMRYLEIIDFDVLVLMPGQKNATFLSLQKLLRRHDRSTVMPIITLVDETIDGADLIADKFLVHKADAVFPISPTKATNTDQLIDKINNLTKLARENDADKKYLRRALRTVRGDLMGLTTLEFFEAHFLQSHQKASEPLCLAVFKLTAQNDTPKAHKSYSQAMVYAAMMGRETDVMTRGSHDLLLMLLPKTTTQEAEKVRQQIIHVIQDLKFSRTDENGYANITVSSAVIHVNPAAQPEEEIARAIRSMTVTFGRANATKPELVFET